MNRTLRNLLIVVLVVLGTALITMSVITQAQGSSLLETWKRILRPVGGGDHIIATVNEESITLEDLERQRRVYESNARGEYSEEEAYQYAMNAIVRDAVLVQEARKQGFTVSEEEARAYYEKTMKTISQHSPEAIQFLQEQQEMLGLDDKQYENLLIDTYRRLLLAGKLTESIRNQAPPPTQEEIDAYLAKMPAPNFLVLMPIKFDDIEEARSTYAELQALAANQTPEQFIITFDSYVRRLDNTGPTEFVHEKFRYTNPDTELPDYAQAALGTPENSMILFERPDGTAVISLVIDSETVDSERVRQAALSTLMQQKQWAYEFEVEEQLIRQADVQIFYENLPLLLALLLNHGQRQTITPLQSRYPPTPPPLCRQMATEPGWDQLLQLMVQAKGVWFWLS